MAGDLNSNLTDLDKSGDAFQGVRAYFGPTLGWAMVRVKPSREISVGGTFDIGSGDSLIFVTAPAPAVVTLRLPRVALWLKEQRPHMAPGLEGCFYIKDLGGNAAASPIRIECAPGEAIDRLPVVFQIVQNRQLLRLYPLNDLTGWFSG
jgi:hypothetical protein